MLTVVTWLWDQPCFRTQYDVQTVITMRDMVVKYYQKPHRFVCVTEEDIPGIETIKLDDQFAALSNPTWENGPSCYRRLIAFSSEAAEQFGERFVSIDLDAMIMGDLSPLWDRDDDIVLLPGLSAHVPYCGSMWMMDTGCRPDVWSKFDPEKSPRLTMAAGLKGSDQAWLGYMLKDEPIWKGQSDIMYFGPYTKSGRIARDKPDCRIMFFNGRLKPWDSDVRKAFPWITEHYPYEQENDMDRFSTPTRSVFDYEVLGGELKHRRIKKKRGMICK